MKGFQSLGWNHAELHKEFEKFGEIVSCKVSIDKDHVSKGYGYVQFSRAEDARNAVKEMNGVELGHEATLSVQFYDPTLKRKSSTKCNLYVKDFPDPSFTDQNLYVI